MMRTLRPPAADFLESPLIAPGTAAPDFTLPNQHRADVTLSAFRGRRHVVIAFHPLAFTPVCSVQVQAYEREKPKLDALDAHVLAISNDAGPSKKAWADSLGGVSYDLLSDFHPHGRVAAAYGVLRDDGLSERAVFVVDKAGLIRWARLYAIPEQPDLDELFRELQRL
jgi:peroxiredoxin (alkyl hydroperoxide reductase subunit C)